MSYFSDEHLGIYDGIYDVYAGFWKRLGAVIVDCIVTILLTAPIYMLTIQDTSSLGNQIVITLIADLLYAFYFIFFHYRFGATLGKMVMGIKVTQLDGSGIGFKHAFLRSSVELGFTLIFVIIELVALTQIDISHYKSLAEPDQWLYVESFLPQWRALFLIAMFIWGISELIFLLFNKRKRALHDFIAATVVINKKFAK